MNILCFSSWSRAGGDSRAPLQVVSGFDSEVKLDSSLGKHTPSIASFGCVSGPFGVFNSSVFTY